MGKVYEVLDGALVRFIEQQHVWFVATAPDARDGHVNLSPKGLDAFRILGEREVAYLDFVGSGAETLAHLRENGRIVLCFCAFEGPPKILRLHGRGVGVEPGEAGYDALRAKFPEVPLEAAVRAVIRVDVQRIADSCGYGVPLYAFQGDRPQLHAWAERKGEDGLLRYRRENNARSLDGLPALRGT